MVRATPTSLSWTTKNLKEYSTKDAPTLGVMYADPLNPKRTIIRAFADTSAMKEEGTERVTLYRDDKHLYINGVCFPMRRLQLGRGATTLAGKPLRHRP